MMQDLKRWLRLKRFCLLLENVFLLKSPWECDLIDVTENGFYTEYEAKVSVADFKADFRKRSYSLNKHEYFADRRPSKQDIPRPKKFYFVTHAGLLDGQELPDHCGLIEWSESYGYYKVKKRKDAKQIAVPTKLSSKQIFNLCVKLTFKAGNHETQRQK